MWQDLKTLKNHIGVVLKKTHVVLKKKLLFLQEKYDADSVSINKRHLT